MGEKPESDAFDDGDEADADETLGPAEDVDLDRVTKDLEISRRRDQRAGEPAWRRLEQLREEKRTAELTSDIEDYDIGLEGPAAHGRAARQKNSRKSARR